MMCSMNNILLISFVLCCVVSTVLSEEQNETLMDNTYTFDLTSGMKFITFLSNLWLKRVLSELKPHVTFNSDLKIVQSFN